MMEFSEEPLMTKSKKKTFGFGNKQKVLPESKPAPGLISHASDALLTSQSK